MTYKQFQIDFFVFFRLSRGFYFLKNPNEYQQPYMMWLELDRPTNKKDETFSLFKKSVLERKKVGEQTENTGD